ncbi:NUDIX domain-containing protein [Candidatus Nomurabacteria bacterium]|nr:NUDIX domain-containing protein [Candidatus Nomurabacteria bacterium]
MKKATCTYLIDGQYVQMAYQQKKIIGFKGYGGMIEEGQSIRGNAVQEIWEETGGVSKLRIRKDEIGGIFTRPELLEPVAQIDFYNGTEEEVPFGSPSMRVYFFLCFQYAGKAIDTVEMTKHQLFAINSLPEKQLVQGDEMFMYQILNGKKLEGWMRRTKDFSSIVDYELYEKEGFMF